MPDDTLNPAPPAPVQQRAFGVLLAAASILMVFGMLHHPSAHGAEPGEVLGALAEIGPLAATVHGGLIVVMVATVAGALGLHQCLGAGRVLAALGAANYAFGSVAMLAAALINGFALSDFASRFAGAPEAEIDAVLPILAMASDVSGVAAQIGTLLWSLGVGFFSIELLRRSGANRAIGALGICAGFGPMVALLSGALPLHVQGFLIFVAIQAVWLLAVSVQLIRRAV